MLQKEPEKSLSKYYSRMASVALGRLKARKILPSTSPGKLGYGVWKRDKTFKFKLLEHKDIDAKRD
jgi:hypothetical protein